MNCRSIRFCLKRILDGILRLSSAVTREGGRQDCDSRSDLLLVYYGLYRALRRLFLAFTAIIFVTGAACAWAADGFGPEQPCPLTPEQARKAVAAFSAMRDAFRHPRCTNCHGVYGDLHDNPKTLHPGGHIPLVSSGPGTEPQDECIGCHDRGGTGRSSYNNKTGELEPLPADRKWELAPERMVFTDRTDVQVCRRFKSSFDATGAGLLKHFREDRLVKLALEGKKGHTDKPADPPRNSANKVIAHGDFIKMAEQWLTLVYGTNSPAAWARDFPGGAGSDCGCDPNLVQTATGTGLVDLTVVTLQSCPGDGKEPRYYPGVTVKVGPHTMKDPASSTLKLRLPAGTYPISAVSESDASARFGFLKQGYPGAVIEPRGGVATVTLSGTTEGLQIGMHLCAPGAAPAAVSQLLITQFYLQSTDPPFHFARVDIEASKGSQKIAPKDLNPVQLVLYHGDQEVATGETDAKGSAELKFTFSGDLPRDRSKQKLRVVATKNNFQSAEKDIVVEVGPKLAEISVVLNPVNQPTLVDEKVTITGRVWSLAQGVFQDPVNAGIAVEGAAIGSGHTDANGMFSVEATVQRDSDLPEGTAKRVSISVAAMPDDKNRYQIGQARGEIDVISKGNLILTAETDKPIYQEGEPVTVSGTVTTAAGKGVAARLQIVLDPPSAVEQASRAQTSSGQAPSFQATSGADGRYKYVFVPKDIAAKRKQIFVPGAHSVQVIPVPVATGYSEWGRPAGKWAHFLVNSQSDTCTPGVIVVTELSGTAETETDASEPDRLAGSGRRRAPLRKESKLSQGLIVETSGGSVALRFGLGGNADATITLNSGSLVKIARYCRDANGKIRLAIVQEKAGQVLWNVHADRTTAADISVITRAVKVTNKSTRYSTGVAGDGTTTVAALEGVVRVDDVNGSSGIDLKAVNQIVVRPGEKVAMANVKPFTGDPKTGIAAGTSGAPTAAASAQGCFGNDRGAAGIRRDDHYNWAQKNPAQIVGNLKYKVDLLWRCPSMTDDQLSSAFADISVIIPRYVTKKACFGTDPYVTVPEWQPHKDWAKQRTRQQILDNLQWKMAAALKCLDGIGQINFFGDSSIAIAKAPLGLGGPIAQAPPAAAQPPVSQPPAPAAPQQPVASSAKGCIGFSGKWNTDIGEMFLQQTGDRVTGNYVSSYGPGRISGVVTGQAFDGDWVSTRSGKMRATLSSDGSSFHATWTAADGSSGSYGGTCAGPSPTTSAGAGPTQVPPAGPTAKPTQPTQPSPPAGPTIDAGGETLDGARTASCACVFAGTWDSTATAPITMKRKGSSVEGTYLDGGLSGTLDGRKLKGRWKDTGGEGPFELEISDASCREFKGTFRQEKGKKDVPWLGQMTQAAACDDDPSAGTVAQTPQPPQPVAPSSQPPSGGQSCFGNDRGAASVRCEDHSAWAQKNQKQIASNLKTKVDQLMRCPTMSKEQLDSAFADLSVVIPRYVTKKACFGTDPHVTVPEWQPHKDWASQRTRDQVLNNLQWKLAAALKCLDAAGQSKFFGDSSCAIAKAPLGLGGPNTQTPPTAAAPAQPPPQSAPAPQQPVSASAKGCVGFSGKWATNHGDVFLNQTGDGITGTNPSNNGTISGRVGGPTLDGGWVQGSRSGKLSFTLAADGSSFKGTWAESDGSRSGAWDGTCTGPPTTQLRAAIPSDTKPQTTPAAPQAKPAQPAAPPAKSEPTIPPQAKPAPTHPIPPAAPPAQPATPAAKPAQSPAPAASGGQYLGCFKDQGAAAGTEGRDLNGSISNSGGMTAAMCVNECRAKNFAYAATQYSSYCFCGNEYGKSGQANNCNMKCAGNPGETCGGAWANSVYATRVAAPATAAAKPAQPAPPTAGPAAKPGPKNGIQVVAGTYGSNCAKEKFGDKIAHGNVTAHLASACNGKDSCDYRIDYTVIGDPAVFCKKNYVAEWRCGDGSPVRNAEAAPEAGHGSVVKLQCGNIAGAVAPTIQPPAAKSAQPQPAQPPTQAAAKGCTLAGTWAQNAEGIGSSTWTIANTGEARESGLGDAKGMATLAGNKLRIDWTHPNGWSGSYEWNLEPNCNSGSGKLVFKSGGSGIRISTVTRQ